MHNIYPCHVRPSKSPAEHVCLKIFTSRWWHIAPSGRVKALRSTFALKFLPAVGGILPRPAEDLPSPVANHCCNIGCRIDYICRSINF